jgi:hypothetical protein
MGYIRLFVKIMMWCAIISLSWIVCSCDEFCEVSNRTAMVVKFYTLGTDSARTMNNMSIQGVGNDSVLYDAANLSSALFPLNPNADVTGYVITNDTVAVDTITVTYARHNGFISSECGCVTYSDISEIKTTNHSIREIKITNAGVSTVSYRENVINAENIRIYY